MRRSGGLVAEQRLLDCRKTVARVARVRRHLTTERENMRIEIAVMAVAKSATTARLSHASTVVLPMPQTSCRAPAGRVDRPVAQQRESAASVTAC